MDDQAFKLLVLDIKDLRDDISGLRIDIASLNAFRWRLHGMWGLFTILLTLATNLIYGAL